MYSSPLLADAILPSLVLVWPVLILLLIPIVVVEALYSRRRLQMHLWECLRVLGIANILSSLVGLPIGHILAAGLQYAAEGTYFRNPNRLQRTPLLGTIEPGSVASRSSGPAQSQTPGTPRNNRHENRVTSFLLGVVAQALLPVFEGVAFGVHMDRQDGQDGFSPQLQ